MDVYKSPQARLETSSVPRFNLGKALLYGLLITLVLTNIVSVIETLIAIAVLGLDMRNSLQVESALASNNVFLVADFLLSTLIFYYAGTVVRKYTPGKEIKYALLLSFITLAFIAVTFISQDARKFLSLYPVWYNILSFLSLFVAIYWGARPRKAR